MDETIPSGYRTRVFDRADWGLFHLMKAGLVERPKRGFYLASAAGKQLLSEGAEALTLADLKKLPTYVAAMKVVQVQADGVQHEELTNEAEGITPEESMKAAHDLLDATLRDDLLTHLTEMNPIRFERLILDLLSAMGFGGGDLSRTAMTKASGDGGIDGIIHEDALGLDRVYVQAKRYASDNKVSSPAIQQFMGSLSGEGAAKGVFVTTSDFSKEARAYAAKVPHLRIVLIDGQELARLMIRYGVGIRARTTFVVHGIDEDYFSDA